ncbi:putative permease MJ0326 [Arthrobacter sp. Hiyo6]|nr:putative permease MJ0326 [Arthrobacter sp. Hiyo6]
MGLVVINGILIVLFGVTGARTAIFKAVPRELKAAITVGIGLFIAFIGFVDSGFVRGTTAGPPVQLGTNGSITSVPTLVFIVGLLAMGVLVARKVQGGLLIGIVATTVLAAVVEAAMKIGPGGPTNPGGWHLNTPVLSGRSCPRRTCPWWGSSICSAPSAELAGSQQPCWCSRWCSPTSSMPWAP